METWLFQRSTVSPKALWKVWGRCLLCWLIMKFPEVESKALGTHNPGSNWSVPEGIICLRNRPSFVHLVSEKEELKFPGEHPRGRRELTLSYSYFGWKSQGPASLGPCPRWFFLLLFVCLFLVLEGPVGFIIEQKCAPVSCYQWILVPCPKEPQNPPWFSAPQAFTISRPEVLEIHNLEKGDFI